MIVAAVVVFVFPFVPLWVVPLSNWHGPMHRLWRGSFALMWLVAVLALAVTRIMTLTPAASSTPAVAWVVGCEDNHEDPEPNRLDPCVCSFKKQPWEGYHGGRE